MARTTTSFSASQAERRTVRRRARSLVWTPPTSWPSRHVHWTVYDTTSFIRPPRMPTRDHQLEELARRIAHDKWDLWRWRRRSRPTDALVESEPVGGNTPHLAPTPARGPCRLAVDRCRCGWPLRPWFVVLSRARRRPAMHGEPGADQHNSRVQPHHGFGWSWQVARRPVIRSICRHPVLVPIPLSHFAIIRRLAFCGTEGRLPVHARFHQKRPEDPTL